MQGTESTDDETLNLDITVCQTQVAHISHLSL